MMTHTEAPAFDPERNDYPLGGAKTGPAWRTAWRVLQERPGDFLDAAEVVERMMAESGLASFTAHHLLRQAARVGLLEQEIRYVPGTRGVRRRAHYRVKR
ncbi:MAG TPA: hypothetical protein VFU47_12565 [Armatimonadota bacterium]|nr:hypothetical protein [Armatimonadota bacterium]